MQKENSQNSGDFAWHFWSTQDKRRLIKLWRKKLSDSDSFIEEVSEEVRRDRLFGLFRKYAWIPILLIIIIVGGAAFNEYRKITDQRNASLLG